MSTPLRFALIALLGLSLFFPFSATQAKTTRAPLSGRVVTNIVQQFLAMHYAQYPLDNNISRKMLQMYLNRLDPGHYYFLASDIAEFNRHAEQLDDLLEKGDVELALHIFIRFKTRFNERLKMLEEFIKEDFDFKKDASWLIDRRQAPYPKDNKEAREVWHLKVTFDLLTLTLAGNTLPDAKERLLQRVRSVVKDYSQYDDNDIVALYLNALMTTYDPHSEYMPPQELNNFDINIKLSLEGIGAVLRWEDGYTVVNSIIPGGAASQDGTLKVNDRVIGVAQGSAPFESVIDMRLNDVVQLIRGPKGSQVRLQVLRKTKDGYDTLTIALVRDKVNLQESEAKAHLLTPGGTQNATTAEGEPFHAPKDFKVGLIRLPSFYVDFNERRRDANNYKSSSRDVQKHLQALVDEGMDGLVLDLRNNGGGGLDEAISMAGLFIGQQPVVIVQKSSGDQEIHTSPQKAIYQGPMVLLVNRYSASASEILAGALQDYGRAILVGDTTTFGKGTVQNITKVSDEYGALKATIAQFYRVAGSSTQNKGVESDLVLPSINNEFEIGEAILENALPWKKIRSLPIQPFYHFPKILPTLKEASQKRVRAHKFFQEQEKDIQRYVTEIKPRKYTTLLQLQEEYKDRKKQRDAIDQAAKAATSGLSPATTGLSPATTDNAANSQNTLEGKDHDKTLEHPLSPGLEEDEEAPAPTPVGEIEGKDAYLEEAIFVLEDFIRTQKKASVE